MGILNSTLRLQRSSLLWFALPLSPLPSQRPSPRPRLTPGTPMDMLATPTLTEPTEAITVTLTPTTERGLLMLSPRPRPRLTPGILMVPMLASTTVTLDTTLDTPMLTTERGLLMLSPRPRLIPGGLMVPMVPTPTPTPASTMVMLDTPMLTTMERGLLMPSPRPMPMLSTDTTAMPGPMVTDTDTEATEATTGDKFLAIQSKSSTTRTSLLVNLTFHPSVRLFGGVGI